MGDGHTCKIAEDQLNFNYIGFKCSFMQLLEIHTYIHLLDECSKALNKIDKRDVADLHICINALFKYASKVDRRFTLDPTIPNCIYLGTLN